jgi:hypothetical protein
VLEAETVVTLVAVGGVVEVDPVPEPGLDEHEYIPAPTAMSASR